MPKKAMETLTESMYYVLMAFRLGPMCGIDVTEFVETWTEGRVQLGPATLYTILGKFEKEGYLREVSVEGRKRTYEITAKGIDAYKAEIDRLRLCAADAQRLETEEGRACLNSRKEEPSIAFHPALSTT